MRMAIRIGLVSLLGVLGLSAGDSWAATAALDPTGACCLPGSGGPCGGSGPCAPRCELDCYAEGGTYQGDDTSCDPNPCPPSPPCGACCFPSGECTVLGAGDCEGAGGAYQGDFSDCDASPCVPVPAERATWGRVKSRYR